jgi:arginine deiminase
VSVDDFGVYPEAVKIIYSANGLYPYDEREQWTDSCNVLAVKEGVVIGFDRNEKTASAFKLNGFDVVHASTLLQRFGDPADALTPDNIENTLIMLPSSELSRGRGGSHCMSLPLCREMI